LRAYLGLGTNLGDRAGNLRTAVAALRRTPCLTVEAVSHVYRTLPVGFTDQPDFYNMAVALETSLGPMPLLKAVLDIERAMGRERTVRWGRVSSISTCFFTRMRRSTARTHGSASQNGGEGIRADSADGNCARCRRSGRRTICALACEKSYGNRERFAIGNRL